MIWFLLINIVSGTPQLTTYANQADACAAYAATAGSHVYQVEDGRKITITEGDCKPIPVFQKK